jgi:hypothetical protein
MRHYLQRDQESKMNHTTLKNIDLRKLDSATKYPSIPTLHEIGQKGRLTDNLQVHFDGEVAVTEKIDGSNVRILVGDGWYIIGSRKELLFFSGDFLYNKALNIVENVRPIAEKLKPTSFLTVYFGELYGGGIGKGWKQYTNNRNSFGFRFFDMIEFGDELLHYLDNNSVETIAANRDRGTQPFSRLGRLCGVTSQFGLRTTPRLGMTSLPKSRSHEEILHWLRRALPNTQADLTTTAEGRSEGVVVRNPDRTKIAKIRFEDYERTIRKKITRDLSKRPS